MTYKYNYTTRKSDIMYSIINGNIYTDNKISISTDGISTDGNDTFYIYHFYENPPYNTGGRWYNLNFFYKNLIIKEFSLEFKIYFNDKENSVVVEFSKDGFDRIVHFLETHILERK